MKNGDGLSYDPSIYLDMDGEAGAEAGREEKEDSLRCEGGPPVLQPESEVIRG